MPIPSELRSQPFTRAQALGLGLSDQALRGSRFTRLVRGVYVCADVPKTFQTYLRAGQLLLGDGARATHVTGLRCYGVELGSMLPVRFASEQPHRSRCDWVRVIRRMRLGDSDGQALRPEQCWVDACLDLDLVDAVIAADWLMHNSATTLNRLTQWVEATDNWEGIRNARVALPYVRENVRSPRETVTRLLLVMAGLPEPDRCNLDVYESDRILGCGDLVWLAYLLVVEYDGSDHRSAERHSDDVDREARFRAAGLEVTRVTGRDLSDRFALARRLRAARRRAPFDPPERRRWTTEPTWSR